MQSIEVPSNAHQRLKTISNHGIISEHLIKSGKEDAMMVYQFVGDPLDVDQLSDKHKISLFDDSRYEDLGAAGGTLEHRTIGDDSIYNGKSI